MHGQFRQEFALVAPLVAEVAQSYLGLLLSHVVTCIHELLRLGEDQAMHPYSTQGFLECFSNAPLEVFPSSYCVSDSVIPAAWSVAPNSFVQRLVGGPRMNASPSNTMMSPAGQLVETMVTLLSAC